MLVRDLIENLGDLDPNLPVVNEFDWAPPTVDVYSCSEGTWVRLGSERQREMDALAAGPPTGS